MGKLKTKKGVAKRFKLTKKGKIKFNPCGKSHLNSNKSAKKLRKLRKAKTMRGAKNKSFVKSMLPYG